VDETLRLCRRFPTRQRASREPRLKGLFLSATVYQGRFFRPVGHRPVDGMSTNKKKRALIYVLMISAVLMPASQAVMPFLRPVFFGAFVVLVVAWGDHKGLSVYEGLGLGALTAIAGPVLWSS
jgi:hypothetical protein